MHIDLNGLLHTDTQGRIAGWFPIYDTLRGIRGSLHLVVKMQFFGNVNELRNESAGLHFFTSTAALACFDVLQINGFVDELALADDPEYHWTDSFRASRISNEERENLLYALSGRVRRQVGCKALALGGNAVLSYRHDISFEGEKGAIVMRGYGTACFVRPKRALRHLAADGSASTSTAVVNERRGSSHALGEHAEQPGEHPYAKPTPLLALLALSRRHVAVPYMRQPLENQLRATSPTAFLDSKAALLRQESASRRPCVIWFFLPFAAVFDTESSPGGVWHLGTELRSESTLAPCSPTVVQRARGPACSTAAVARPATPPRLARCCPRRPVWPHRRPPKAACCRRWTAPIFTSSC